MCWVFFKTGGVGHLVETLLVTGVSGKYLPNASLPKLLVERARAYISVSL